MAIASITSWLTNKNPDFLHGRMLYEQYGDDQLVLTIIRSGSGSYHFNKLKEALESLNTKIDLVPKQIAFVPPIPVEELPGNAEKGKMDLKDAPAEIRKIRDDKNRLYAEARHLHAAIRSLDTEELRLEASLKLLDSMDKVNEMWVDLDTFREFGEIAQKQNEKTLAEVKDLSTADLLKELRNLPTYISKNRGNVLKENDPVKKSKYQLKVQHLIARLTAVQRRVNEIA